MTAPILFKPWTAPNGAATCVPDPQGKFVAKADYDALAEQLAALKVKDEKIKEAADAAVQDETAGN